MFEIESGGQGHGEQFGAIQWRISTSVKVILTFEILYFKNLGPINEQSNHGAAIRKRIPTSMNVISFCICTHRFRDFFFRLCSCAKLVLRDHDLLFEVKN